jgi:hypothetical protein
VQTFKKKLRRQRVKAVEGHGIDFRWCYLNFSLTKSFRPHYGPGVDSASNRNEYQEYFLEVKAAGAYGWQTYHLHEPIVLKSGRLNLLEPSGFLKTFNAFTSTLQNTSTIKSLTALYRTPYALLIWNMSYMQPQKAKAHNI